jgi:hypothetical protein
MSKMAGGGIPWPQSMANTDMPKYTSTELFDVYHTHTKDCKVCSRGKHRQKSPALKDVREDACNQTQLTCV